MNDVVKPSLICFDAFIKSSRSSNIGDINEVNLAFPFRMKSKDCFGFRR